MKNKYYYNLLKTDPEKARAIVFGEGCQVENFLEDQPDQETIKPAMFNTLSVIYDQPQEKFLQEGILKIYRKAEKSKAKKLKEQKKAEGEEESEEPTENLIEEEEEDVEDSKQ